MLDRFLRTLRTLLERFLLVWLVLSSLAAYYWTTWFPGAPNVFVGSKPALGHLIAATMLAIGSLLPQDEVRQVIRRWPVVLGGTTIQYLSMPLLAYVIGRAFGFEGSMLTGVVLVGCVPGAMASNVLTLAARGNVSYSVSLTTTATLLSPLVVPLALWLTLGQWMHLDVAAVGRRLFGTVVVPVVLGYLLSRCFAVWRAAAERVGSTVANLTILWIIAVVVGDTHDRLSQLKPTILVALLMINLGGYLAGYGGSRLMRLRDPMRRALTLEIGMQNAGVGTWLATEFFANEPTTAIPPAMYTFGCMLTGTVLARLWAEFGQRPPDEGEGEDKHRKVGRISNPSHEERRISNPSPGK